VILGEPERVPDASSVTVEERSGLQVPVALAVHVAVGKSVVLGVGVGAALTVWVGETGEVAVGVGVGRRELVAVADSWCVVVRVREQVEVGLLGGLAELDRLLLQGLQVTVAVWGALKVKEGCGTPDIVGLKDRVLDPVEQEGERLEVNLWVGV